MGRILCPLLLLLTAVAFEVISAQDENRPPIWKPESVIRLTRGISEATAVGTSLAQLECEDPDGDGIVYARTSGQVVSVTFDGIVRLQQPLEFDTVESIGYDVTFTCVDVDADFGFELHAPIAYRLKIAVDDANDNAPEFNAIGPEGYSFEISEAADDGTVITSDILITDADRTVNAEIVRVYFLCNSPNITERQEQPETSKETCEKFDLTYQLISEGRYRATITLKAPLDFETRAVYSTKMIAFDRGDGTNSLSAITNVQVSIDDAQDLGPIFTNLGSTSTVREDASKGDIINLAISARDGDVGDSRPVRLSIISDKRNAFSLSPTVLTSTPRVYASNLIVNNSLDREEINGVYPITVQVTELNATSLEETTATATATYSVTISDVNDETPEFDFPSYEVEVTEMTASSAPVQITGLRIVCRDLDSPPNAAYRVRIVKPSGQDIFSISPDTTFVGVGNMFISVDQTSFMDYDIPEYRNHTLVLEAKETTAINPKSSSTTVTILLTDVNDNSPQFVRSAYTARISENQLIIPTTVLTLSAADKDSGLNGEVEYILEQQANNEISLNYETGALTLQRSLDYEDQNLYVYLVYARDKGEDPRSSQVQVTIEVTNYNDEAPVFQQTSYQTSVNEGSSSFLTPVNVRAVDNEDGTVRVTYSIVSGQSPNNAFVLNRDTGSLTLNQPLRYEDTIKDENNRPSGRFELIIEATDNSSPDPPQTSQVPVTVFLIDQNNYSPVLNPSEYFQNVSEVALPDTVVADIEGTDNDEGDFGRITYRLESGGFDNFVVDPDSGVVTVNDPQNFDFDQRKSYLVRIKATDGGSPQRAAFASVFVDILDANNKDPKFVDNIYTATVREEESINFTIVQVFATDSDSTADLRFSILRNTIKARDGDGNELISSVAYNYLDAIGINPRTGDVFVNGQLDKETALEIYFEVEVEDIAADGPRQTDTTQVSLTVTGEIDDNIIFDAISQNFMNENTPTTFVVATLVASDPTNPQSSLLFSKLSGSTFFEVTSNGFIRPSRNIDFERDPLIHRLVVQALTVDRMRSATATVTINILDVNDNSPEFDRQIYYAQVDEDDTFPHSVATIRATDADSSSYGPIVYRIGGGVSSSDFELFETTIGISVLIARGRTLDYNRQSSYTLDIIALDNPNRDVASNQNRGFVTLRIDVVDKNNNFPTFLFAETFRSMAVAETAPTEKNVGTVIATDDDVGINGEIRYSLESNPSEPDSATGLQLFRMIPELGTIVVSQSLLGLGNRRYPMRVRASDLGQPPNSALLNIEINVLSTEIDDGSPLWVVPSSEYNVSVIEERANEIVIAANFFQVTPRTGRNITFSLPQTFADSFEIDRTTGEIKTARSLDREMRPVYELIVYAEDTTNPQNIRSGQRINVNLIDINDNDVSFSNPRGYRRCGFLPSQIDGVRTIVVEENIPANTVVYQLAACDPDGPNNNEFVYESYSGNNYCMENDASSDIEIKQNGHLVARRMIDYEQNQEFILCVQVRSLNPSNSRKKRAFDETKVDLTLDHVIYIQMVVRDQNDNAPRFVEDTITTAMTVRPSVQQIVVPLNAFDPDGPAFNSFSYSIRSVTYHDAGQSSRVDDFFIVGSGNSIFPTRNNYEGYLRGYFSIQVLVTDNLNPQLQGSQEIKVYVYRPGQVIKVILNFPPLEGYSKITALFNELNAAAKTQGYDLLYQEASEHTSSSGDDFTKTDICFVGVNVNSNELLDKPTLIRILEASRYETILSKSDYNVVDRGACYPSKSSEDSVKWRNLWWVLVAVAIFLFVCCLIFIVLVCILYRRYKRYMKSKQMYLVPQ